MPSFDYFQTDAKQLQQLLSKKKIDQSIALMIVNIHDSNMVAKSFRTPRDFPLNPIVNKSYKIECCGNKMHKIVQNMILTRGLELKLSLL